MTKRTILACLTLVTVVAVATVYAAAVKVILLPLQGIEPEAEGQLVLNYAKGMDKTIVQLNCRGLTPGETYMLWLSPNGGGSYHPVASFMVKKNGTGTLHHELLGDHSGHLPAAVNNSANLTVLLGP